MTSAARRVLPWLVLALVVSGVLGFAYLREVVEQPGPRAWDYEGVHYQLLDPRWLAVVLVTPLLVLALGVSLAGLPWQQRVLALSFRVLFIALLGLGLSRLVKRAETARSCVVFLVDVSDSVPDAAVADARGAIAEALSQKGQDDQVRLVTFAQRPRAVEWEEHDGKPAVPDVAHLRHLSASVDGDKPGAGTDLQAALQLAYGLIPSGYLKRVVLFSDGVETSGDLLSEASRAAKFGVRVSTVPYRRPPPGEVAVRSLRVPQKVQIGEPFEIVANVFATRATTAKARLYQGDVLNGLDGVRDLELTPGQNELTFRSVVRFGGEVTYALKLSDIGADTFHENDAFTATLDVPGRPTVLYVEGQPARASYLASALGAQQFDVDVRSASGFPGSLAELERYDMLIVSDVPAEQISISSQDLIERYVRDLGGGFLFAGGVAGYGLGGWAHTTVERILPVRMDAERRRDIPSLALALVIDRSGSMTGLPMEMAKAACKATVGTLEGDDLVEIIAFDSIPTRYVKMQPARYRSRIQNDILRIQPGGGTEIMSALDAAYQDISVVQARKKHVILLTDGKADSRGIRDLVQAMISESITVTTVGLGDGADSELLRLIADTGGGRYHHVPDANSLPRIFTRETEMIARQAAVEEWFPVTRTGSADFLRGIAVNTAPLLHGYVATQMKPAPAQMILASDKGEPILARWRVGLGHALAWTSDVKNQWAVDWLRWNGFSRFWGQLVREHMRKKHRRELDMKTEVVGGSVHAVVDAFTPDQRFDNAIQATLFVEGPTPKGKRREIPMRQTAPGRYESSFELGEYGSFVLHAEHFKEREDGTRVSVGNSYGNASHPYPREYESFEPDLERLERAAMTAGGSVDPPPARLFDPEGETIVVDEPLWGRFVQLALIVFLLDLLMRRVRLFDRKQLRRGTPRRAA